MIDEEEIEKEIIKGEEQENANGAKYEKVA